MTSTPREIGTLVVVILRARHLPNKRHIGKQDPYCCVSMNGEKRRTKALKRGGQHPEWDEEVRFTLWEDVEDELQRTAQGDGTPPAPPPRSDKEKVNLKKIKGGKILKVSCYADDPREPDLIGETTVDLTEVLTKGETDEWFTLTSKDKFCGQVYLEMTFWSNERPPKKKPTKFREDYGGAGSFVPLGDSPSTLQSVDENGVQSSRISSMSSIQDHSRHTSNSIPPSLRASSSLARLDLYVPPYQSGNHGSVLDRITNDFGQLEVVDHRRDSFPPLHDGYIQRPSSSFSSLPPQPSHSYEQALRSDGESMYSYDRPLTPPGQTSLHHRSTLSTQHSYPPQTPYQHQYEQQPYENGSPAAYPTHQPSVRGPRYSIPSSSSGFVPISNSSSFTQPLQSYPSDPTGFVGPQSSTPAAPPSGYSPSHYAHQSGFAPLPSQTPIPNGYAPPQQSQFTPSQSFTYSQYPPPPSMSTPLQQQQQQQQYMAPPQPPQSVPPQTYSAPPPQQPFAYSLPPSPPHENIQPAPLPPPPQNSSLSSSTSQGSRPLPPQPQVYAQQQQSQPSYGMPPASYSPNAPGSIIFPTANPYQSIPPPPPPPSASHMQAPPTSSHMQGNSTYAVNGHISNAGLPIPPPPPPAPPGQSQSQFDQGQSTRPRRQSSLPQPPVLQTYQTQQHQQPAVYQPIPPPPPPPLPSSHSHDFSQQPHQLPPPPPLLPAQNQSYYPGPPPQPPAMINHQPHWSPQHNGALPSHGSYIQQGW